MNPQSSYQIIAIQLSVGVNNGGYHHIDRVQLVPLAQSAQPAGWYLRAWLAGEINAGRAQAKVIVGNVHIRVGVEHVNGVLYLRTQRDGTIEDNLLHLPTYDSSGRLLISV
jgi:hypothetical protein